MSFRDARQRAAACRALAALAGELDAWTATGPAQRALDLADGDARITCGLSPAQHALHRLAWDLWSGTGCTRVLELWMQLDAAHVDVVAALSTAIVRGGEAIDAWLVKHAPPTLRAVHAPNLFAQTADHTAG